MVCHTLLKPPNTRLGIPDASPDPVNFQQSTPRSQNTCTSVAKHKAHPRILRQLVQRESGLHRDCSDLIRRLQRSSSSQRARRSSSRRTFFKLARSSSSRLARRPACLAAPCADGTARKQRHVREQATGADRERESRGCKVWGARCVRGRGAHRDTTTPKIAITRRRTAPMTTIIAMAHVGILSFDSSDRFASC